MSNFRPINRETGFLLPPSVDESLPKRHLGLEEPSVFRRKSR
jgi:hypothetical protein